MTDTPTTAEQMREAAARACEAIEDFRWQKWKAEYDPNDQGMSIGACECAAAIRALPCAPDPRIAALEAERDRLRALVADTEMWAQNLIGAIDEWQIAHMTGDGDLVQKGEAMLHRQSLLRAWLNARAALEGGGDG